MVLLRSCYLPRLKPPSYHILPVSTLTSTPFTAPVRFLRHRPKWTDGKRKPSKSSDVQDQPLMTVLNGGNADSSESEETFLDWVNFSEGTLSECAQLDLKYLMKNTQWTLTPDRTGLQRIYRFNDFHTAWSFMDAVAGLAHQERHHPEWSNLYNRVYVRWTTHEPAGLSNDDIDFTHYCEELAEKFTLAPETDPDIAQEYAGKLINLGLQSYKTKTFKKIWEHASAMATIAQEKRMYPLWSNCYNRLHVSGTWLEYDPRTSKVPGFQPKELDMPSPRPEDDLQVELLRELVNKIATYK